MTPPPATIFLVVSQGFAARALLRTGVLDSLRGAGARVAVLAPNVDESYLRKELCGKGVQLEPLRADPRVALRSRLWWLLHVLRAFTLGRAQDSPAFLEKYMGFRARLRRERPLVALCIRLALQALWRSRSLRRALLFAESRLFQADLHADLFRRHRPDLVVAAGPGWSAPDAVVLREAARRGVPTVAVVLGWDNPTSKGYRGAMPDRVLVWSERMASQMTRHQDVPPRRLAVAGVPQFDHYLRAGALPEREELFRLLGLDPKRALVVFATSSPGAYRHNLLVARALAAGVSGESLARPAQLVVRLHPINFRAEDWPDLPVWRALCDEHEHVRLDIPEVQSRLLRCDMPRSDMLRLGGLISYCDVLVNVFSTTTLEAFLADRPVVLVSTDAHLLSGDPAEPGPDGLPGPRAVTSYAHMREVVDAGAAEVARSLDELPGLVDECLRDPGRRAAARRRVAAVECGPADGRAAERVAAHLLELAGTAPPSGVPLPRPIATAGTR